MSIGDRLTNLTRICQEQFERGMEPDVDELCRDCPELPDELHRRVAAIRQWSLSSECRAEDSPSTSENLQTVLSRGPAGADSDLYRTVLSDGEEQSTGTDRAYPPQVPGYEVLKELGRGGMGVVYLARDRSLQRTVALKMIVSGEHASAVALNRFQKEVEAVARLQHSGAVQIYDVGKVDGLPDCTLEYCNGGSLATVLRSGPLSASDTAHLVSSWQRPCMRCIFMRSFIAI